EDLRRKIEAAGGKAIAVEADVLDRAAMTRAFDAAEKAFGTVTILVNNAGIAHADRAVEMDPEKWRRVLAAGKKGAIINIASVLGFGVAKGVVAYTTAKAGVIQLTRALAVELGF